MKFQLIFFLIGLILCSKNPNYNLEIEYGTPGEELESKEYEFDNKQQMDEALDKQVEKVLPENMNNQMEEIITDLINDILPEENEFPEEVFKDLDLAEEFPENIENLFDDIFPKELNNLMDHVKKMNTLNSKNLTNVKPFVFKMHTQYNLNPKEMKNNKLNNFYRPKKNLRYLKKGPQDAFLDSIMGKVE